MIINRKCNFYGNVSISNAVHLSCKYLKYILEFNKRYLISEQSCQLWNWTRFLQRSRFILNFLRNKFVENARIQVLIIDIDPVQRSHSIKSHLPRKKRVSGLNV